MSSRSPHERKNKSTNDDSDKAVASMPHPDSIRPNATDNYHDGPEYRSAALAVEYMMNDVSTGHGKPYKSAPRESPSVNRTYPVVCSELARDPGHSPGDRPIRHSSSSMDESGHKEPEVKLPKEWVNLVLQPIPIFYPMEQSNVVLNLEEFPTRQIMLSILGCLKAMSVQAKFFPEPISAALLTQENVEMHLALWRSRSGKETVVEIQRRRGCSITFHRYGRRILDAARGDFVAPEFNQPKNTGIDCANLKAAEALLYREVPKTVDEQDDCFVAIKTVHALLEKPRLEARILGMETLCVLANLRRAVISTTLLVSRIVLLGKSGQSSTDNLVDEKIFRDIHVFLLSVILNRSMGDDEKFTTDSMEIDSDDENVFESDDDGDNRPPELREVMSLMFNLALTVLSYTLEVMLNFDALESEPAEGSSASVALTFLQNAKNQEPSKDLLQTLLDGLHRADKKPHNACLCAQCLRFLCEASDIILQATLDLKVRDRTKYLKAVDVVEHARHIGESSHAKLKHESGRLLDVLRTKFVLTSHLQERRFQSGIHLHAAD